MASFFKTVLAAFLALVIFTLLIFFFTVSAVKGLGDDTRPRVADRSVLVIDLGQAYMEQMQQSPLAILSNDPEKKIPGLYEVIRLIKKAKNDGSVSGILIKANPSPNGFAASTEIRNALLDFKSGGKFIIAHADILTQRTYAIANVADTIYVSPQGMFEWVGYSVNYAFVKGTLDKLDIEPQIFYAGKFKSATEPFRTDKMTEENKLQTSAWMNELYDELLIQTATARKLDTANLRRLANEGSIRTPQHAVEQRLIDGVKYDDEVRDAIKKKLDIGKYERINFITINAYRATGNFARSGGEKIALIFAEGDIIDGKGDNGRIGSESYRSLLRKARLDRSIKAIVLRVNSGGGSALASENIWREMHLAKQEKPVIVSFGDVAASGGYYIASAADSIFAQSNTITGSIGVFGIIPNMEGFFKNKLGITFDGVQTGPYADAMSVTKPMTEDEKKLIQAEIENVYALFKKRVAEGRKRDTAYIDSIAQGRIWTGTRAKEIGLIDKVGGIEDAVASAAAKAGLTRYQVREFPEREGFLKELLGRSEGPMNEFSLKEELGEENYRIYLQLKRLREITNTIQARLPFELYFR